MMFMLKSEVLFVALNNEKISSDRLSRAKPVRHCSDDSHEHGEKNKVRENELLSSMDAQRECVDKIPLSDISSNTFPAKLHFSALST